jgi:hypothetical protein
VSDQVTLPAPTKVDGPGVYNLPEAEYHARPELSSTGARRLLPPSAPAHFKHWLDNEGETKPAWDRGKAAHKLVLGAGPEVVAVADEWGQDPNAWRTDKVKAKVKAIRERGDVPLKQADYDDVHAMADAIRKHPEAVALLDPALGKAEQTLIWRDERTGVMCRALVDFLRYSVPGRRFLLTDYKHSGAEYGASPEKVGRTMGDLGYHVQLAWYLMGCVALGLCSENEAAALLLVQESRKPYLGARPLRRVRCDRPLARLRRRRGVAVAAAVGDQGTERRHLVTTTPSTVPPCRPRRTSARPPPSSSPARPPRSPPPCTSPSRTRATCRRRSPRCASPAGSPASPSARSSATTAAAATSPAPPSTSPASWPAASATSSTASPSCAATTPAATPRCRHTPGTSSATPARRRSSSCRTSATPSRARRRWSTCGTSTRTTPTWVPAGCARDLGDPAALVRRRGRGDLQRHPHRRRRRAAGQAGRGLDRRVRPPGRLAAPARAEVRPAVGAWTEHDVAQLSVIGKSVARGETRIEDEFPPERVTAAEIGDEAWPEPATPGGGE